jgi:hypothetical protein
MILALGVRAGPGGDSHLPVLAVLAAVLGGGFGPDGGVSGDERGAVAAWAAGGWLADWVGREAPPPAQPYQDGDGHITQFPGQPLGIVARIEDEQRWRGRR